MEMGNKTEQTLESVLCKWLPEPSREHTADQLMKQVGDLSGKVNHIFSLTTLLSPKVWFFFFLSIRENEQVILT
jgi:hypothetical protein